MSVPGGRGLVHKVQANPADSSLNCEIAADGVTVSSLSDGGCGYMFAGVRANVGVYSGRWFFHLKVTGSQTVNVRDTDLLRTSIIVRVGVSQAKTPVGRLGETKDGTSVGYNSSGKKVSGHVFSAYGAAWATRDSLTRDIITVLVDLESDVGEARVSWARNGAWQGKGFSVPKPSGQDTALYPHVLFRNCTVSFDFATGQPPNMGSIGVTPGSKPFRPWAAALQDAQSAVLAAGWPPWPADECEVVMLVGLPGSGKTTWAVSEARNKPDKHYTVLSPDACLDAMRVLGLARKQEGSGSGAEAAQAETETDVKASAKSGPGEGREGAELEAYYALGAAVFNMLLERAPRMARNYILDQAHVALAKRTARITPFRAAGFRLRAALAAPFPMWLHMMQEQGSIGPPGSSVHKLGMRLVPDEVMASLMAEFEVPLPGGPEGFSDVILVHPPPDSYFDDEGAEGTEGQAIQEEAKEDTLDAQLARIERVVVSKQREQGRRFLARQGLPGPAPNALQAAPPSTDSVVPRSASVTPGTAVGASTGSTGSAHTLGMGAGAGGLQGMGAAGGDIPMELIELVPKLPPEVLNQLISAMQMELVGQGSGGGEPADGMGS